MVWELQSYGHKVAREHLNDDSEKTTRPEGMRMGLGNPVVTVSIVWGV